MRSLFLVVILGSGIGLWAQNSSPSNSASSNPQTHDSTTSKPSAPQAPSLAPPRSDSVNASALPDGESSSKDDQIDLSPPENDTKAHPRSSEMLMDEGTSGGNLSEFHPWDPHKAAKDIEVGDFYFKRKNYRAAEDRYREALFYKDNDAVATFRLALCLEKMNQPEEARQEYESYLNILPHGPLADDARKAIDRVANPSKSPAAANPKTTSAK